MDIDPAIPVEIVAHLLPMFSIESTRPHSGGLSGARVWRCTSSRLGQLCLRQWPSSHPTPERLLQIHRAMQFASEQSLDFVPKLGRDSSGNSFWKLENNLWEVTQWLPGEADYLSKPSEAKLISACSAIARMHGVWRDHEFHEDVPPSIRERQRMLAEWMNESSIVERVGQSVASKTESDLCLTTIGLLKSHGPEIADQLDLFAQQSVGLHPVLRDVWNDHLLFHDDQTVGIIDYGAVRVDDPALDLARMLGSLEPFDNDRRALGIATYNALRLQSPIDPNRVDFLDRCGTLLTALQWMRWLVIERRKFTAAPDSLIARWQRAIMRLQ